MHKRLAVIILLSAVLSVRAFAQGSNVNGEVIKSTAGQGGAKIRVCTEASTGTPCSPLASIYTNKALTIAKTNPFTADSTGNYSYFVATGCYKEQTTAIGTTFTRTVCEQGTTFPEGATIGNGAGNDKMAFTPEPTDPSCGAGNYFFWANASSGKLKKCENGSISDMGSGTGGGFYQRYLNNGAALPQRADVNWSAGVCSDDAVNNRTTCSPSGGSSVLTTKGDIAGFSTIPDRIPVGADGDVLTADSSQALGVRYATPPAQSNTFATGVIVGDGAGNDKISMIPEATNPTCGAGAYYFWSNSADGKIKKCQNGTITDADTTAAAGTEEVWLTAGGCNGSTGSAAWDLPTSLPFLAGCADGRGIMEAPDLDGAYSATNTFELPSYFNTGGTTTAKVIWRTTLTTGNVVWRFQTRCWPIAGTSTGIPAYNGTNSVTSAVSGTTNTWSNAQVTLTMTGCAASSAFEIKLSRDRTDASDTLGADAPDIYGVMLSIPRS